WPNSVMTAQNDWIGKKEGVKITHQVVGMNLTFESFSAYPAWSWADSYIVIAPEHPVVKTLVEGTEQEREVLDFVQEMAEETELERKETTEKKGVFTGRYAKDPFGGPDMPIWLANFALMNFGTGIIRCSGHDERDIAFAEKYHIPTREVIDKRKSGKAATPHDGEGGILHDSGQFSGKDVWKVVPDVIDWIEKQGIGKRHVNYHLHDWSVSRQRYWGTPVPMIHCEKCGMVPVPEKDLPVTLPYDVDYQPKGKPPLASNPEWLKTTCPKCGGEAERDPETLDTFFDSSWYYYRYVDPHFKKGPFEPKKIKEYMPVDIYFGGGEHTLGHTLYARFFTKFFKDLEMVDFEEFAMKRVQHGIVLGPDGNKMSKSKGNVINPDDVVKEFGTDAVRVYLSFMMPYGATGPWSTTSMYGSFRFLKRIWDLQWKVRSDNASLTNKDLYEMHRTIKKVTDDISETRNNTAVAALMEWLNFLEGKANTGLGTVSREEYQTFLLLLAPFAPFMTEEVWQKMFAEKGNFVSVHQQSWPVFDKKFLVADKVVVAVQVNGKLREAIVVSADSTEEAVVGLAKTTEKVQKFMDGKKLFKTIYVPGKIVNFVVGD
ncbi:MAG: leucine--tRNA ligase, partial [Patescibacteria group bacterium]|nr:leucine--tRNA ligase [Patescibacteria group bacterium]